MDIVAYERWNESGDAEDAKSGRVNFKILDEELLVFCPECFETAETFDAIEHRRWCLYGEPVPPGEL